MTALITGASGGIGRAIARALGKEGYNLILTGRNKEKLEQTARLAEDAGSSSVLIQICDLSKPDAPSVLMKQIQKKGCLDILINNAGMALSKPFEKTTDEDFSQIMTLNAAVPFALCRDAIPLLRQSKKPFIINIASVVATHGYAQQSAYTASKHALLGFTKSMARELQPEGIRVHAISPGGVATEMVTGVRPDINTEELIQPEEIAEWIVFLLTRQGNSMIDEIPLRRVTKTAWS